MSLYQAESFYRAKIKDSITDNQAVPITIRLSTLPTRTTGLLTISPNTEYEEIVEFDNVDAVAMTIDITKRGISPVSIALTIDGTDYNNTSYMRPHTTNDIIRGDVNHLHINQGIGNSTLATAIGVGIVRLATAPTSALDPVVVGDNDTRLVPVNASTTVKGLSKLSVAPVSATEPIACGDNDPRLTPTLATEAVNGVTKLSVAPASVGVPIAVGDNDTRLSIASTTVSGRVEIATQAEVDAETTIGGTGAILVPTPALLTRKELAYRSSLTANASFTKGDIMYSNGSNIVKYSASSVANNIIGVALSSGISGDTVRLVNHGVAAGFTGLTPGVTYYASNTAGTVSTSPGTYNTIIGVAISATEILLGIEYTVSNLSVNGTPAATVVYSATFTTLQNARVYHYTTDSTGNGYSAGLSLSGTNISPTNTPIIGINIVPNTAVRCWANSYTNNMNSYARITYYI